MVQRKILKESNRNHLLHGSAKSARPVSKTLNVKENKAVRNYFKVQVLIIGCLLIIPDVVFANAGVPMIFLTMPGDIRDGGY